MVNQEGQQGLRKASAEIGDDASCAGISCADEVPVEAEQYSSCGGVPLSDSHSAYICQYPASAEIAGPDQVALQCIDSLPHRGIPLPDVSTVNVEQKFFLTFSSRK